jgi:hypothetical protein
MLLVLGEHFYGVIKRIIAVTQDIDDPSIKRLVRVVFLLLNADRKFFISGVFAQPLEKVYFSDFLFFGP